jgi:hypothetical protein
VNIKELGYDKDDMENSPYASFYNPDMAPLPEHVVQALVAGPVASELMYPPESAAELHEEGYGAIENGYTLTPDGGAASFCLTEMPGVTPEMVDWWFGWHGKPLRYRLWHPHAHMNVEWEDGLGDQPHYIGRTSLIEEYLGSAPAKVAVSFVAPSTLGLDEAKLAERDEFAMCARVCLPGTKIKAGWLLLQVRPVPGGSEMRSRTWLGGDCMAWGDNPGPIGKVVGSVLGRLGKSMIPDPYAVLVHTSQEMSHLATFLPAIYKKFGNATNK